MEGNYREKRYMLVWSPFEEPGVWDAGGMLGRPGAWGPQVGPRRPRLTIAGTVMLWFH